MIPRDVAYLSAETSPGVIVRPLPSYSLHACAAFALVAGLAFPLRTAGPAPVRAASHDVRHGASVDQATTLCERAPRGDMLRPDTEHSLFFTRGVYSDRSRWGRRAWATDYPKADCQFLTVLRRLTNIDAYAHDNAVALDDPELRRYPFLYMLEVGNMALTSAEIDGLRNYLLAGGFVFIDDFWGTWEWQNFEHQMRLVLPEHSIVDLPLDHEVFRSLYQIREIVQVPAIGNWRWRGITHEQDGYVPHVRGIFAEDGRLMMMINWNTDIGDAWEWAEQPDYPLRFSTFAYQMGANAIIHAMSH